MNIKDFNLKELNIKDFPAVSVQPGQDPPHRAVSRAPADHNVAMLLLGLLVVAGLFGLLWALYAFG